MLGDGYHAYFTADNGVRGREWYYFSGGLYRLDEIVAGSSGPIIDMVFEPANNQYAYFLCFSANDFYHGNELFRINQSHVYLLKDINPSGSSNISNFTYNYNIAFFTADDGVHGEELWTTDGTPSGTRMLTDMRPGFMSSVFSNVAIINGKILFSATNGSCGAELFEADLSTLLSVENDKLSLFQKLNIYPNPAKDNITIETAKTGNLIICNIEGKELINQPITDLQSQINVSMLPTGLYIAKFITDKGVERSKFIKE